MFGRLHLVCAAVVFAFALTACGGGGGSSALGGGGNSPAGGSPASGTRNITFTLTIPSSSASTSSTARSVMSVRKPATISSQTASISVSVNGGTPQIFNASVCSGNPLTCTLSIGAPYGLDSFLILTYSGSNATGTLLNAASVTINVTASGPNSAAAVAGTVITVNDAADGSGASFSCAGGATTCTLREAVAEASNTPGVVTAIMFASSVTSITIAQANGYIVINAGQTIEILGPGASAANSSGIGAPAASGNLTISGGNNTGILHVSTGSSLTVSGLTFSGGNNTTDTVGGAISNYGGTLAIVNAIFSGNGNTSITEGGAVFDTPNTPDSTTVLASTFSNNTAQQGGAYYDDDGASFSRCLFTNNVAFDNVSYGEGGAIYTDSDLFIDTSTFTGNVAGSLTASSISAYGGAISIEGSTVSPTITNSTFGGTTASAGNFAGGAGSSTDGEGGAVYNSSGNPLVLSGNTFTNNTAKGGNDAYGGAVDDNGYGITSSGDTFTNNVADATDVGSNGYSFGGAVYSQNANDSFTQVTFTGNTAKATYECDGGGLYNYGNGVTLTLASVQFTNNTCSAVRPTGNAYAYGGGLEFDSGLISFLNVTVSGNTATATAKASGYSGEAYGGGFEYESGACDDCAIARSTAPADINVAPPNPAKSWTAVQARAAADFARDQAIKARHLGRNSKHADAALAAHKAPGTATVAAAKRRTQSVPAYVMDTVTITNNTATAQAVSSAFAYAGGLDLSGYPTFNAVSVTGNSALASGSNNYAAGGGIAYGENGCSTLTITATVANNIARNSGGGIFNRCSGVTVANSTISGNRVTNATQDGDGGGGVTTYNGTLTLAQDTIINNTVAASSPVAGTGGGGIMNYDGTMTVTNVTIFGNQSAIDGGGFENGTGCCSSTTSYLTNVTIYQNTALGKGGSIDSQNGAGNNYVYIENSIFAGGSAPTGAEIANGDTFVSYGGNLIQGAVSGNAIPAASQGIADLLGVSPALVSTGLASNGGLTQTIADTSTSPGKAHIPFSGGMCGYNGPAFDQRGYTRGAGGFCDIGAYEFSGTQPLP